MRIGAVFPQIEIGPDPGAVKAFAQAAEQMGYTHLLAFDHVVGANRASRPGFDGPYDHESLFHEPLVLFGYLAGLTSRIELTTGVIILPQRQAVLVAKQAAEVDVLSHGRLRLGIGIGWNDVEYEALGENFKNRGRRSEEQVELMQRLWTEPLVTFEGKYHKVTDAGLNPLPVQRPIPVWFGGQAEAVLDRVARLGQGWFPLGKPDERMGTKIERLREKTRAAGRDPAAVGIESWVAIGTKPEEEWAAQARAWRDLGATHLSVYTVGGNRSSPDGHIQALEQFKRVTASL